MKNPFKKNAPVADIGATVPAGGAGYGVTVPAEGAGSTIPVDSISDSGIEPEWINGGYSVSDVTKPTQPEDGYPRTEPGGQPGAVTPGVEPLIPTSPVPFEGLNKEEGIADIFVEIPLRKENQEPKPIRPVVGWLVCTKGANRGSDYRVYNGYNYIGRAQSMDICIPGDSHISNENAAVIGYDDVEREFYVGSATGHNTVRLNGKLVLGQTLLNAYDKVKIGETTLTFIPLCGEKFDWNGR